MPVVKAAAAKASRTSVNYSINAHCGLSSRPCRSRQGHQIVIGNTSNKLEQSTEASVLHHQRKRHTARNRRRYCSRTACQASFLVKLTACRVHATSRRASRAEKFEQASRHLITIHAAASTDGDSRLVLQCRSRAVERRVRRRANTPRRFD